jgi:hypothetical protein
VILGKLRHCLNWHLPEQKRYLATKAMIDAFIQAIQEKGLKAVIPPRSNRLVARDCDWFVYTWLNAFSVKSNITDECFLDLTNSPETTWALFASFLLSFGYVEMSTEPRTPV